MTKQLSRKKAVSVAGKSRFSDPSGCPIDPKVEALVTEVIGRVADKWTMLVLEVLDEEEPQRFSKVAGAVAGISQKMLTKTLRLMERDGLLTRRVYAEVPPRVEYTLTPLGQSLSEAFCEVWCWAADNLDGIERSRRTFDAQRTRARA